MKSNVLSILIILTSVFSLVSCKQSATVNLEAAIIYKMGGAQPIARNEFYLLDKSAGAIFKEANIKPKNFQNLEKLAKANNVSPNDERYHLTVYLLSSNVPQDEAEYLLLAWSLIDKHRVKTLKTDLQGKAQITDVEPKSYYLFGTTKTRGGEAIWNLPVEIKSGQNTILLDQNNAIMSD